MRFLLSSLPYTLQTAGEFRDLRQVEVRFGHRFARVSLNGIHRINLFQIKATRLGQSWVGTFGLNRVYVNWTHYQRHCFHLCLNVGKRGITFSYGRWL